MPIRPRLLVLLALAWSAGAQADIYKCRTADGSVEISNTPCASPASTLKSQRDEPVSEAQRREAEREVARMKEFVEKREAAQRADAAAERETQAAQAAQAATSASQGNAQNIDDCLRQLDSQAVPLGQRSQMEAACRSGRQPVVVPVYTPGYAPGYAPVYGGGGNDCVNNVMRQNLPAAERQRRIAQCQGGSISIQIGGSHRPEPRPQVPVPVKPSPTPPPAPTLSVPPCPANKPNCR